MGGFDTRGSRSGLIEWGAQGISNGLTFLWGSYLAINTAAGASAEDNAIPWIIPYAGFLSLFFVRHNTPAGVTNITYTVRVNAVNTALIVVLNSGAAQNSNTADRATVNAGDRVSVSCQQASGGAIVTRTRAVLAVQGLG